MYLVWAVVVLGLLVVAPGLGVLMVGLGLPVAILATRSAPFGSCLTALLAGLGMAVAGIVALFAVCAIAPSGLLGGVAGIWGAALAITLALGVAIMVWAVKAGDSMREAERLERRLRRLDR